MIEKANDTLSKKMQMMVKEIESLCNAERFEEADEMKNTLHQSMELFSDLSLIESIDWLYEFGKT